MKIIQIVALTIVLMLPLGLSAQTNVKGIVVDSLSNKGEVGAVIQFLKTGQANPVAYATTDSLGCFSKVINGEGDFVALFSGLGRKEVRKAFHLANGDPKEIDLGTLMAEDDATAIESASVSAMKTLVKLDVDKLTYKVESDPDAQTNSVLEMLRKVPMVTVDAQDNITVNGSGSFKVYVDGKPNQMISSNPSQILKVMPASAIKDIEVITNPGAKYDAEGVGGVLNLITSAGAGGNAVADGVYGSVQANAGYTIGDSFFENGGLFLSAKKDKFTFGANVSLGEQKFDKMRTESSTKQLSQAGDSRLDSHSQSASTTPFVFGNLNASYEVDPQNLISASLGVFGFKSKVSGPSQMSLSGLYPYSYSSDSDVNYKSLGLNGSVDFQHSSSEVKGRTLTLSYRISDSPVTNRSENIFSDFSGSIASLDNRKSDSDDYSVEHTFQFDYTTPLSEGHSLSSGLKYILRHNSADDKLYLYSGEGYSYNQEGSMVYDHFNNIAAAYSEYSGTFGKLGVKAGLRYEFTWQKVDYGKGYGQDFNSHYGDLVPNGSIQWNITPTQNLGLTYNMRIQRPGITYLNPFVDRSAVTSITYGNSDINSAKSHIISLVYNFYSPKWVVSVTGRYSYCGNGISAYSFYDGDILNNTYGNVLVNQTTGLNAYVNWTAGKNTRIYANSGLSYLDFSSDALDQSNSGWGSNLMLGCQQTLPADIQMSLNLMLNGRGVSLQGWNSGFSGLGAGFSKSLLKEKLKLQIQGFTNLSKGDMKMENHSSGKSFDSSSIIHIPIRQVTVGLTYTFGKNGFQVKKADRTIQNDDVINTENQQNPANQRMGI